MDVTSVKKAQGESGNDGGGAGIPMDGGQPMTKTEEPGCQNKFKPLRCPYFKNHLFSSAKLTRHLVRCNQHYLTTLSEVERRDPPIQQCKYDFNHIMLKGELAEHEASCPAKENDYEDTYWEKYVVEIELGENNVVRVKEVEITQKEPNLGQGEIVKK